MSQIPLADRDWWCWLVLASTFYITFTIDGYNFSFGVLKLYIEDEYEGVVSQETVSIIGGLGPALYCLLAPVAFGLIAVFSVRTLTIVGGMLSTLGFLLGFANGYLNWGFAIDLIALGVIQGVAGAFLFGPCINLIPTYFRQENKAFATGITTCGSPAGAIVYSYLIHILIDNFGWRGTLPFFALGSALILLAGLTFVPKVPATYEPLEDGPVWERLRKEFETIFNRELFGDPIFITLLVALIFSILSFFVPTLLIVEQANDPQYGVSRPVLRLLILFWGIAQLLGRLFVGWLADFGRYCVVFSSLSLFVIGLILSAVLMLVFPHVMIYGDPAFITFVCIYGFISAPFITLRSTMVQDLYYEKQNLIASSFGWCLSAEGMVIVAGFYLPTMLNNIGPFYAYLFAAISFLLSAMFISLSVRRFCKMYRHKTNDMNGHVCESTRAC